MGHMLKHNLAVLSADGSMVKVLSHSAPTATGTNLLSYFSSIIKPTPEGTTCKPPAGNVITDADLASLQLRASISQVEKRIDELNAGIAGLLNKAKACKAEGNTQEALVHLKIKRTREQARERLIQSLLGLVEAQDMIGQCAMNVLLTNAYRAAATGLRTTRSEADLTADTAAEAMESFQEEMEEMSHISDVLNAGFQTDESPEAQAQLEAELQELLDEAEKSSAKPAPEPVAELAQAAIDITAPATTADTTAPAASAEPVPSSVNTTAASTAAATFATQPAPAATAKTDKKTGKGKKHKQKQQQQEPAMSYAGAVKTTETNVEEEEEESLPVPPTHTVALSEGEDKQEEGEKGEETAPVSA